MSELNLTIYTFGGTKKISMITFFDIITTFNINCVVDIRNTMSYSSEIEYNPDNLKRILQSHSIFYLPFKNTIGYNHPDILNSRGYMSYKKAISAPQIQNGLERLENGINKGFKILVLDNEDDITSSKRFTLVGKYLNYKGIKVVHVTCNKHYYTQEEVEGNIKNKQYLLKTKNEFSQSLGKRGEDIATNYLMKKGFRIIDRNWNLHKGCELDIVAIKDDTIHFVEVKTRSSYDYGAPQQAIGYKKMKNIHKAIHEYRYRNWLINIPFQIDSIAIVYRSDDDYELNHYEHIGLGQ